ncbi:short chain dehydrogenase/reductase [Halenospora varia]|nr:short chain dehydrogenase/reductase [Halenospora varia]
MSPTVILITGANSGVGYATTKVITSSSENYHVIMACRNLKKAEKAKTEIEAAGIKGSISIIELNVTDQALIDKAVKFVEEKFGKLDVLVNNAAGGFISPDVKQRFQSSLETNVTGPAMVAAALRPLLLKAPKPYSLFISSGAGSLTRIEGPSPIPNGEAYMASKAALNMVALMEWHNFKPQGLHVFSVCPGFVVSNLRGPSEEARTGWGKAGDPEVSGRLVLSIIEGKRDSDDGKFVWTDGTYPW